jgi:hypothetical protein
VNSLHDVVRLENSVHDGDVLSRNLVDGDVADLVARIWGVDKEEDIPAVKCWLHGATYVISMRSAQKHSARAGKGCCLSTYLSTTTIGDSVFVISPRPL